MEALGNLNFMNTNNLGREKSSLPVLHSRPPQQTSCESGEGWRGHVVHEKSHSEQNFGEFSGNWVARLDAFTLRAQVQSLDGELRSCKSGGTAKRI